MAVAVRRAEFRKGAYSAEYETHMMNVAGFSESGVLPITNSDITASYARSRGECPDTGLGESGDDDTVRLALHSASIPRREPRTIETR